MNDKEVKKVVEEVKTREEAKKVVYGSEDTVNLKANETADVPPAEVPDKEVEAAVDEINPDENSMDSRG